LQAHSAGAKLIHIMQKSKRKTTVRQAKAPRQQDPFRSQAKPAGLPECPKCGAINKKGGWTAKSKMNGHSSLSTVKVVKLICPACKQLKEKIASGVVEIHGEKFLKNKKAVLNTINKTEKIVRARNDQGRILWTKEVAGLLKVYVSVPELARHIGRELEKSFKGSTEYSRSSEEPYLRVKWWSDQDPASHEPGAPLRLKKKGSALEEEKPRSRSFRGRGRAEE
jgi:hypothetical protein